MEAARNLEEDGVTRISLGSNAGFTERWLEELVFADIGAKLILDLSRLSFASPHLVVRIAAWLDFQANVGASVDVIVPQDVNVANYLSRVGLGTDLPEQCSFPLVEVQAVGRRDVLLPLTRIQHEKQVEDLALDLRDLLEAHFAESETSSVADSMVLALQELCDNGLSHGQSDYGCYVAAQRYEGDRCVLAIGDLGIGIPGHIRKRLHGLTDDAQAIAIATSTNETGTEDDDRGDGYRAMLATIRRGQVAFARLSIWAGAGRHVVHVGHGRDDLRRSTKSTRTEGSWIEMEIRTT